MVDGHIEYIKTFLKNEIVNNLCHSILHHDRKKFKIILKNRRLKS